MDQKNNNLLQDEINKMTETMTRLLKVVGKPGKCSGCKAEIYWVKTKNDKWAPYNSKGENHFSDCPQAGVFRQ